MKGAVAISRQLTQKCNNDPEASREQYSADTDVGFTMSSRRPRPDYVHAFHATLIMLAGVTMAYMERDAKGAARFALTAMICATFGILFYVVARYNASNPASPIRLWLRQCLCALAIFLIALYSYCEQGDDYIFLFLLGIFLVATAGYYFIKDRARII